MSDERLLLSEKYKAFIRCDAPVEFLEGTTAAGKTTVGLFKFMLKVAESKKKLHISCKSPFFPVCFQEVYKVSHRI
jgi:phage terminase large subunit